MTKTLYKVQGTSSIKIGSVDWLKQSSSGKESEGDQVWPRRHIKFKGHQALKMSTLSLLGNSLSSSKRQPCVFNVPGSPSP